MRALPYRKGGWHIQKFVYLSNSRDYTEQGDINENKYFTKINSLLEEGWTVTNITPNVVKVTDKKNISQKETMVAFVLLEKPESDG